MKRLILMCAAVLLLATPANAAITMCDTGYENCRIPIIERMDAETVGIDMFIWFAEDYRYVAALDRAKRRGVRVRVIGNDRWGSGPRKTFMDGLVKYKIPTRVTLNTPSHIKAVVFEGQHQIAFTGGNFTSSMVPDVPFLNYIDEVVMLSDDQFMVDAFMRTFEDAWTNNTLLRNFTGVIDLARKYPHYPDDPRVFIGWGNMNAPLQHMSAMIDAENVGIDIVMYRLNDQYTRAALLRALARGVPVRILSDPDQYPVYSGMKPYMDAVIDAGAQVRWRVHEGMTHEKFALFYGQNLALIPSNNFDPWVAVSATISTTDAATFIWGIEHFNRKWNEPLEFQPGDRW